MGWFVDLVVFLSGGRCLSLCHSLLWPLVVPGSRGRWCVSVSGLLG